MNCIDLMSKRSKIAKLQKQSNYDQFASIWRQNDQKCWVTSQNILNNAKLQNWSNYNELHRFDVKTIKNRKTTNWSNYNELHRFDVKTIKTTQNYKSDQIITNCIDLTSKRSKTKVIKLQWSAMIWHQNNQKCRVTSKHTQNAKLQKQSNKDQFASIWRQNDQKCWVTSQNILNNAKLQNSQNYKSDQITMNCIDLMSKRSKQRKTTKVIKL